MLTAVLNEKDKHNKLHLSRWYKTVTKGTKYNSAVTKISVQEDVQYHKLDISNFLNIEWDTPSK